MLQDSLLAPRPAWLPDAFEALITHELLTARQLAALLDKPRDQIEAGLAELQPEGLLTVHQPLAGPHESPLGAVYALTRRGARATRSRGGFHVRRSSFTVAHDVLRNEVGLVLTLLERRRALTLMQWETSCTKLADAEWLVVRNRPMRVPLVADALAVVDLGAGETSLLFEIDRGTVSVKRMLLRYRAYQAWWEAGGPVRRFGSKRLRILTLVPDEARRERLRSAALAATGGRGSGLFWFAVQSVADVEQPQQVLAARWRVARADDDLGNEALFPLRAAVATLQRVG